MEFGVHLIKVAIALEDKCTMLRSEITALLGNGTNGYEGIACLVTGWYNEISNTALLLI